MIELERWREGKQKKKEKEAGGGGRQLQRTAQGQIQKGKVPLLTRRGRSETAEQHAQRKRKVMMIVGWWGWWGEWGEKRGKERQRDQESKRKKREEWRDWDQEEKRRDIMLFEPRQSPNHHHAPLLRRGNAHRHGRRQSRFTNGVA